MTCLKYKLLGGSVKVDTLFFEKNKISGAVKLHNHARRELIVHDPIVARDGHMDVLAGW